MEVRGRLVRPVAGLWAFAGAGLLASELVRLVDVGELGWPTVAGLLACGVAWRLWHAGAVLDEHGLEVADLRGRRRVLWSTLDRVEVDLVTRIGVPVRVHRSDGSLVAVDATWGLSRAERAALVDRMRAWCEPHHVDVDVLPAS